jgi:hypothetical protein
MGGVVSLNQSIRFVLCALFLMVAHRASADAKLTFDIQHSLFQSPTGDQNAWDLAADLWPSDWTGVQYDLTSPTGSFHTVGNAGERFTDTLFTSFDAMKAAATGDWKLSFTNGQGTSHYLLHPDLSSFLESSIPETRLLAPTPEQVVSTPRPMIQWTSPGAQVSITSPFTSVTGFTGYDTYVPESDLPDGDYFTDVTLTGGRLQLPLTVTLLDGPGIGNFTFGTDSTFDAITDFTVVTPEPMNAGLILLGASTLLRRFRRHR